MFFQGRWFVKRTWVREQEEREKRERESARAREWRKKKGKMDPHSTMEVTDALTGTAVAGRGTSDEHATHWPHDFANPSQATAHSSCHPSTAIQALPRSHFHGCFLMQAAMPLVFECTQFWSPLNAEAVRLESQEERVFKQVKLRLQKAKGSLAMVSTSSRSAYIDHAHRPLSRLCVAVTLSPNVEL